MSSADQRKFPRLPVNISARYRSDNLALEVQVSNLSQAGVSLRSAEVDPLGTRAEITLELPTETEPLLLFGRVIWVSADPDRGSSMGIGFDQLPKGVLLALANYVLKSSHSSGGDS